MTHFNYRRIIIANEDACMDRNRQDPSGFFGRKKSDGNDLGVEFGGEVTLVRV